VARRNAEGPRRRCAVCRVSEAKPTLHRIVRDPGGRVADDPSGHAPGRGAYLCGKVACLESTMRVRAVARVLRAPHVTDVQTAVEDLTKRLRLMNRK
jgi:predicted RNA-binding protein YlxR (DUF448 family)